MEKDIMNVWFGLESKGYRGLQFFRGQRYENMAPVIHRWWNLVRKNNKVFAKDGTLKKYNGIFPLKLIKDFSYDPIRKAFDKVYVEIDYSERKGLYVSSVEMDRCYTRVEINMGLNFDADKVPTIRMLIQLMNKTERQSAMVIKNPLHFETPSLKKIRQIYDLTKMRNIKNGIKY